MTATGVAPCSASQGVPGGIGARVSYGPDFFLEGIVEPWRISPTLVLITLGRA